MIKISSRLFSVIWCIDYILKRETSLRRVMVYVAGLQVCQSSDDDLDETYRGRETREGRREEEEGEMEKGR